MKTSFHIPSVLKLTIAVGASLAISSLATAAPSYILTDLGMFGSSTTPTDINNAGVVVGNGYNGSGIATGFVYNNGVTTTFSSLGGSQTGVTSINNQGQIVGTSTYAGSSTYRAVYYTNGVPTNISVSSTASGIHASARKINNNGQILVRDNGTHIYSNGVTTTLNLSNTSVANDLNDNGQVVGRNGVSHAFVYQNGVTTDLGVLATTYDGGALQFTGLYSEAFALNNSGQIVGTATIGEGDAGSEPYTSYTRAMLYENGTMKSLGTLCNSGINCRWSTSQANDINNSGQIVGKSLHGGTGVLNHAFVYQDGSMADLNSLIDPLLGWVLADATAINDKGQIVGGGWVNGQYHAYLLTPTVPVPASAWLFGSAMLGLIGAAKKRRS